MDRHNGRSYPWAAKSLIAHDSRKEARSSGSLESLSCHAWQDASVKDGPAGRWAKMRTFLFSISEFVHQSSGHWTAAQTLRPHH